MNSLRRPEAASRNLGTELLTTPCKDGDDIYGVVQDGQVGGQVAREENRGRPPSFFPCSIVAEISGTINRFNHLSSLSLSSSGEISRAADPKAGQQKAGS